MGGGGGGGGGWWMFPAITLSTVMVVLLLGLLLLLGCDNRKFFSSLPILANWAKRMLWVRLKPKTGFELNFWPYS